MLTVRKGNRSDYDTLMRIYSKAREFMIHTGNPDQWRHNHPAPELIKADIENGICHVVCEGENVHGVFALCKGDDPTYSYIEDGKWLNNEPYVTIHRIAGDGSVHGILKCAVEYSMRFADNIRIDTHRDNKVMQGALAKNGFEKCGVIYLLNGEPRIAFQRCCGNTVFREITAEDDEAVARLVRTNLEKAGLDIPGTAYFDPALDRLSTLYGRADSRYYVLLDAAGEAVGGIGFAGFEAFEDTAEMQKLYLADSAKGKGLGYKMVYHIEAKMREAGFKHVYLETHSNLQAAIHIYDESGYREIPRPKEVVHGTMDRFFWKDI
jgi:putative acetyltransferase